MRGPQHYTGGRLRAEFRGRLDARDKAGDDSQPRDELAYRQHSAIREKEQASRRAGPILGPKIHMPQIVTSKVRSADTRRNLRGEFTASAATLQINPRLARRIRAM